MSKKSFFLATLWRQSATTNSAYETIRSKCILITKNMLVFSIYEFEVEMFLASCHAEQSLILLTKWLAHQT